MLCVKKKNKPRCFIICYCEIKLKWLYTFCMKIIKGLLKGEEIHPG